MNKATIEGRIAKVRKLGRNLTFAILIHDFDELRLIFYSSPKIKKGDRIKVVGFWKKKGEITELEVLEFKTLSNLDSLRNFDASINKAVDLKGIKKLLLRSKIESEIHNFFKNENFNLVTSPTIVGDWVKGQTGCFSVNFYDETAYLTISNMLFHHVYASLGFSKFYEIGKLFRQEKPSSSKRLAEFSILDFTLANANLEQVIKFIEKMINNIYYKVNNSDLITEIKVSKPKFNQIQFSEILSEVGMKKISGHQFNSKVKKFLNNNFSGFVWITNFPENTRPFYVRCENGFGIDCQLWFEGLNFLAAGGERETNKSLVEKKILAENKNLDKYQFYLKTLDLGIPKMCSIGLGIERFISTFIEDSKNADFVFFPVYEGGIKH